MAQLIIKTFLRSLLIFLPVFLLFDKDTSAGQSASMPYGIGLIALLVLVIVGSVWWVRRLKVKQ